MLEVGARENNFAAVSSWAWISTPTVNSHSCLEASSLSLRCLFCALRALASCLSCLRRGTRSGEVEVWRWRRGCEGDCHDELGRSVDIVSRASGQLHGPEDGAWGGGPTATEKESEGGSWRQIHGGEIGRSATEPVNTEPLDVVRSPFQCSHSTIKMRKYDDDCQLDQPHRQSESVIAIRLVTAVLHSAHSGCL